MFGVALTVALWSVGTAQFFGDYGWHHNIACPYEPPRPKSGRDTCDWIPMKHPLSGCIMRWRCEEVEPSARPCPEAPAKPTTGKNCNWVAMRDDRGCILDYECEPVTQPPCPRRPQRPDNTARCYYRAIKNNDGCVVDYECEPLGPGALPIVAPRPYIAPRSFVAAPHPVAPLPAFNAGWGNVHRAAAAAQTFNAAALQNALGRAQAQANFANSASLSAFAPRIPILKDDGQDGAVQDFQAESRKGNFPCEDAHKELAEVAEDKLTGLPTRMSQCQVWAETGECKENPQYMSVFCEKSCRLC